MSNSGTGGTIPVNSSTGKVSSQTSGRNKILWSEDLHDFLSAIDAYNPTLPEAVSNYYLEKSGLAVHDDRISKLVSLASDKFLSEIIYEAKQISLLRQQGLKNNKRRTEMAETLETEDLEGSIAQMRIFLRRKKMKSIEDK